MQSCMNFSFFSSFQLKTANGFLPGCASLGPVPKCPKMPREQERVPGLHSAAPGWQPWVPVERGLFARRSLLQPRDLIMTIYCGYT